MKHIYPYLLVGLGGFLGANARFIVARISGAIFGVSFPYGTLIINVTGSFALGILVTLIGQRLIPHAHDLRLAIAIGFLGSFTTFSTMEYESHSQFESGSWMLGMANLFGSLFLGLIAVRIGILLVTHSSTP